VYGNIAKRALIREQLRKLIDVIEVTDEFKIDDATFSSEKIILSYN
jgi:hypothetical protein